MDPKPLWLNGAGEKELFRAQPLKVSTKKNYGVVVAAQQ